MTDNLDNVGDLLKELHQTLPLEDTTKVTGEKPVAEKIETPITQLDTIQKAEQKDAEKGVQAPGNPMPAVPSEHITPARGDVEAFLIMFNKVESQVINHILDTWQANIEENKRVDKEELERKIRMGMDRIGQFASAYASKEASQTEGVSGTRLAVANLTAFTIMSAFTVAQLGAVHNPVAMNNLHNLTPGVFAVAPAELQLSIAMTGALFSSALLAPALMSITGQGEQSKGQIPQFALATQVADQSLKLVRQGVIGDFVNKDGRFASLTNEQRAELISRFHLTFLMNALALFYEKETGWITEEELTGLISQGKIFQQIKNENPNDPRLALVAAIRQEMKGLSSSDRDSFMKDSLRYLSKNPSYDSARELHGLLQKMWDNLDYEQMSGNAA